MSVAMRQVRTTRHLHGKRLSRPNEHDQSMPSEHDACDDEDSRHYDPSPPTQHYVANHIHDFTAPS